MAILVPLFLIALFVPQNYNFFVILISKNLEFWKSTRRPMMHKLRIFEKTRDATKNKIRDQNCQTGKVERPKKLIKPKF